jgi:hypothetical protein
MDNWLASCIVQEARKKIGNKKIGKEIYIKKNSVGFLKKPTPFN